MRQKPLRAPGRIEPRIDADCSRISSFGFGETFELETWRTEIEHETYRDSCGGQIVKQLRLMLIGQSANGLNFAEYLPFNQNVRKVVADKSALVANWYFALRDGAQASVDEFVYQRGNVHLLEKPRPKFSMYRERSAKYLLRKLAVQQPIAPASSPRQIRVNPRLNFLRLAVCVHPPHLTVRPASARRPSRGR